MAVVIEATSVVIMNAALERRFPGGVDAFAKQVPNNTYHSDGELVAVSFMVESDARRFVGSLAQYGFPDPWCSPSKEVSVVGQSAGLLVQCDWLNIDLCRFKTSESQEFTATIAWTGGEDSSTLAVPAGWRPQRLEQISSEDLKQNYELVNVDREDRTGAAVVGYRHRVTGRMMYVARTPGSQDTQTRYDQLREELGRVMEMPNSRERAAAAAQLYEEASKAAEQSESAQELLRLQGVAARLGNQWRKAESAFRAFTEQWPDDVSGWLELTWALASQDRLEQAEKAARRAVALDEKSASAQGNLASVLLQSGRSGEALPVVERALELDPSDTINQRILVRVREVIAEQPPAPQTPQTTVPWYKRWFR